MGKTGAVNLKPLEMFFPMSDIVLSNESPGIMSGSCDRHGGWGLCEQGITLSAQSTLDMCIHATAKVTFNTGLSLHVILIIAYIH